MLFDLIPLAAVVGGIFMVTTLGIKVLTMINQHLERKARLEGGSGEVDELRHEVGDLTQRLTEIEERLDFTERMLAQSKDRELKRPS